MEIHHLIGNKSTKTFNMLTWKQAALILHGLLLKKMNFYLTEQPKILTLRDQSSQALFKIGPQNKAMKIQIKKLKNWLKNFHKPNCFSKINKK